MVVDPIFELYLTRLSLSLSVRRISESTIMDLVDADADPGTDVDAGGA